MFARGVSSLDGVKTGELLRWFNVRLCLRIPLSR